MQDIDNYIIKKTNEEKARHKDKGKNHFHVSQAMKCPRELYFQKTQPKDYPIETLRIFAIGDILHQFFQERIKGDNEVELKIKDRGLTVSGRIDKLTTDKQAIEFKTMSNIHFCKTSPSPIHIAQLNLYLHNISSKTSKLVYIDKRNMDTVEYIVSYNHELYKQTIERFCHVRDAIIKKEIPAIPEQYKPHTYPCSYCLYREECKGAE